MVRFDDLDGKPLATIVHYACHPTIMAWDNQWFTTDYPGMVRQVVEREAGGTCLFLQGATGAFARPERLRRRRLPRFGRRYTRPMPRTL